MYIRKHSLFALEVAVSAATLVPLLVRLVQAVSVAVTHSAGRDEAQERGASATVSWLVRAVSTVVMVVAVPRLGHARTVAATQLRRTAH